MTDAALFPEPFRAPKDRLRLYIVVGSTAEITGHEIGRGEEEGKTCWRSGRHDEYRFILATSMLKSKWHISSRFSTASPPFSIQRDGCYGSSSSSFTTHVGTTRQRNGYNTGKGDSDDFTL